MKTLIKCLGIMFIFLIFTLALLHVDRQGYIMYGIDNSIRQKLDIVRFHSNSKEMEDDLQSREILKTAIGFMKI